MRDTVLVINENDLPAKRRAEHEAYEYIKYEVTPRSDFPQCYTAVYELPPRKANYPYHYHIANTEVFYIISGEGCLITPSGEQKVHAGDFIVMPPAKAAAHKLINTSESEVLRYIDFDTANVPDIVKYPDSDKVGIITRNEASSFYRHSDEVSYYTGE